MENEKNLINQNLVELFKSFTPSEDAPEDVKREVFQTLDTLKLIGDIADLFTDKLAITEASLIDIIIENQDMKNR